MRFNYSTLEGVAVAWDSAFAWQAVGRSSRATRAGVGAIPAHRWADAQTPPDTTPNAVLNRFAEIGIPFEVWDAATIRARLPALDPGRYYPPKALTDPAFFADAAGELDGYWTPDAGFIDDPQLAAQNLAEAARRHGAVFRFRTTVTGVERGAGRVTGVRLADGALLAAPVVVNAAGPWSHRLNELADVLQDFAVDTRPLRQEVHALAAPPGFSVAPGTPGPFVADLDFGSYLRGAPGGGMVVGGIEADCDPLDWVDDPDALDVNPTKPVHDVQVLRAARRMPELAVPDRPRGIAGLYDVTDDWIPIYDRTSLPGYYVAIGTSGNQFKNAPSIGLIMAAVIAAGEDGRDPGALSLPYTGRRIDLAHYGRRRAVHLGSSFTVLG